MRSRNIPLMSAGAGLRRPQELNPPPKGVTFVPLARRRWHHFAMPRRIVAAGLVATLLTVVSSGCVTPPRTIPGPYPPSDVITRVRWDLSTVPRLRSAYGSDLWPMTWARDGELYAAWGDGGGFDGNESSQTGGKASLGFARITGIPQAHRKSSYHGQNIWGTRPYARNQANFGGKVTDIISVNGVLYAQGGLWTAENCHCADPTQKGESNSVRTLTWSVDMANTWTLAPWSSPADLGASLKFGPDYRGALDPQHVYLYYQRDVRQDPAHIYFRRVRVDELTADPATPGHFEYFTGLGTDSTPDWSRNESDAIAIFTDSRVPSGVYSGPDVVYNASLGRYLLTSFHGNLAGQIGIFESAAPWGPWATVAYYDDWGGFNETASEGNGISFPAKWIGADGKTLWAVFSGLKTSEVNYFDSFNVARLKLKTHRGMARILSPSDEVPLTPGALVTARGTGSRLQWTVSHFDAGSHQFPLAQGTGRTIKFAVPAEARPGDRIRLTLTATPTGSVYRDFAIKK